MAERAGPDEPPAGVGDEPEPAASGVDPAAVRRRGRLAEIFGDVLPESTSDDLSPEPPTGDEDRWYLENRPPHH
jgi:hypothetical protein